MQGSGYLSEDTIAAIGTALGGAIAMIRVSGSSSFQVLAKLTKTAQANEAAPRKLSRSRLFDAADLVLDDALYVRFIGPESYTGEDVVEFHIHGGAFTASRLMEALAQYGVRQALPGEFSFRAVRNGKMALSQAQAVSELISALNDGAVSLALEKMSGSQNRLTGELSETLRHIAVLSEAGIDFADQDIDEVSLPSLRKRLDPVIQVLKELHASYDRGVRVQEGIGVAFVGLPNAGKSSFFNALLGDERSIVSEFAGTTRDVVRERITLRGNQTTLTLRLEDTAGLRQAEHPVEQIGIERSQRAAEEADIVLLIVDVASSPTAVREQWTRLGRPANKTLGIFSKTDLVNATHLEEIKVQYSDLGVRRWVTTSSTTGAGIPEAIVAITEVCDHWIKRGPGEVLLTRLDHLQATEQAIVHLGRAAEAPEIDLFAADIRQALQALGPLIGETLPDDILGKIFSEFFIGK